MDLPALDEMETVRHLPDGYQPLVEGPLVELKKPITTLLAEYAHGDPVFRAKIGALIGTHSYRPIKGDGQCGWRGAVFGYFETLLQIGDLRLLASEKARLQGFNNLIAAAGMDLDMICDFFDSTWELFDEISDAFRRHRDYQSSLLRAFNSQMTSNSILLHFRMMTSAFMHNNAQTYEEFLQMPLEQYLSTRIQPTAQEIDQIGLQALTAGLIAPAGIALEVSYLDRSQGDNVNIHYFVPDGVHWPSISLLYRPGHYDLLYKEAQPAHSINPLFVATYPTINSPQFDHFEGSVMDGFTYMCPSRYTYSNNGNLDQGFSIHQHSQPTSNRAPVPLQMPIPSSDGLAYRTHSSPENPTPLAATTFPSPISRSISAVSSILARGVDAPATTTTLQPVGLNLGSPPLSSFGPQNTPFRFSPRMSDLARHQEESRPPEPGSLRRHDRFHYSSSTSGKANFLNREFQPKIWKKEEDYKDL